LFQVWAATEDVALVADGRELRGFARRADGVLELFVPGAGAGTRYGYRLDGAGPFPDPASRFQPEGVHALSEVIASEFAWTDGAYRPGPWEQTVFYELHVGTFTSEGTFAAAVERLGYLRELGVTAIELMPLADSPGRRNWGYDGVSLYAPNRNYGRPEDLRRFVDRAHAEGLAVYLDVVYNHLGPDGAYHRLFHPDFYSPGTHTPWGEALRFDGPARAFFLENGLYWVREFHIDGFRLDATHAIQDASEPHFLAEFTAAMGPGVRVVAEDARNLAMLPREYGLDGVWADDFHHQIRVALAGDRDGYFSDYDGSAAAIADTLRSGWFYRGQHSQFHGASRGTPTDGIDRSRFVICIDNHDQSGNRAVGDRMQNRVDDGAFRAASAVLLLAPETPLLFMGQEWASSSPFQFFTDHNEELGRLVTEGRRREFAHFVGFAGEVPDPQAEETFLRSKLRWEELDGEPHAGMLRWYRELLGLRRRLREEGRVCEVREANGAVEIGWHGNGDSVVCVACLTGESAVSVPEGAEVLLEGGGRCVVYRLATPASAVVLPPH